MNIEEAIKKYKDEVGVCPVARGLSDEEIVAGIADPALEKQRLRAIDLEDDQRELKKLHEFGPGRRR